MKFDVWFLDVAAGIFADFVVILRIFLDKPDRAELKVTHLR